MGGEMWFCFTQRELEGHPNTPTIEITFKFPDGIQEDNHPKPGQPYTGTTRLCFLPATNDALKVLQTITDAYRGRSIFTIGTSVTHGKDDCVIWNGIHFKTRTFGGATMHGYP